MHIQVNTDSNINGREELEARVAATVQFGLARFDDYLTGVEVHLGDESAGRSTGADQRCMIEARPAGRTPVAVTAHAASLNEALSAAIGKLATVLGRERSRHDHHKGATTIRSASGEASAPPAAPAADDQAEAIPDSDTTDSERGS